MYVQRNIETRSCNHCCSGKVAYITYLERVYVDLIIQNENRMCRESVCGLPDYTTFSTLFS
jgi:hypothetical protein